MKRYLLLALAALMPLLSAPRIFSAETNTASESANPAVADAPDKALFDDLKDLVSRINDKIQQDKTNDSDLSENLKEFEVIIAKHKDAKPETSAQVLAMKAKLYLQVLDQPDKALAVFKKIQSDYPTAKLNGNTQDVISTLEAMIEKKKISDSLKPGTAFPDFQENDVEGKPLSISQYKGKVVLVDFWATWCGPCVMELPTIQKAYDKFHEKGFEIVGISLDENKGKLQQFVKEKKMPWQEFFDGKKWENKLAVKYGIEQTPTGYLLGRDGKIIAMIQDPESLETEIAKAMKD